MNEEAVAPLGVSDHLEEASGLLVIGEDLLTAREAVVNVVQPAFEEIPVLSRHDRVPSP